MMLLDYFRVMASELWTIGFWLFLVVALALINRYVNA